MSAFSDALLAAIKHEQLTQVRAAELCGVDQSLMSRWLTAKTPPSRDTLPGIYAGFYTRNPLLAIELVVAHLHDEARATGIAMNQLSIAAADSEAPPDVVRVPKELRDDFAAISAACTYEEVVAVVKSHGEMCRAHLDARAAAAKLATIEYPEFGDKKPRAVADKPTRPRPPRPGATG